MKVKRGRCVVACLVGSPLHLNAQKYRLPITQRDLILIEILERMNAVSECEKFESTHSLDILSFSGTGLLT